MKKNIVILILGLLLLATAFDSYRHRQKVEEVQKELEIQKTIAQKNAEEALKQMTMAREQQQKVVEQIMIMNEVQSLQKKK